MRSKKLLLILALISMSILFIQCEKKPVDKLEIAQMLVKKMEMEESSHYAPEKYEMAMNHFHKSQDLLSKKDYKKAATQLEYCINVANAALSKTQNEKENEKYKQKNSEVVYSESNDGEEENSDPAEIEPKFTQEQVHFVQSGECLSCIAKKYYKSAKYWKEIFKANKAIVSNPDLIKPGQQLIIPSIQTEIVLKDNEYQVQRGETLWSISEKLYTDSKTNHWNIIYQKNKSKISNPNLINSGVILVIPSLSEFDYSKGDSIYLVKKGDSFWSIAQMMNALDTTKTITWQDIFHLNMTELSDSNSIYPDDMIKLPN